MHFEQKKHKIKAWSNRKLRQIERSKAFCIPHPLFEGIVKEEVRGKEKKVDVKYKRPKSKKIQPIKNGYF